MKTWLAVICHKERTITNDLGPELGWENRIGLCKITHLSVCVCVYMDTHVNTCALLMWLKEKGKLQMTYFVFFLGLYTFPIPLDFINFHLTLSTWYQPTSLFPLFSSQTPRSQGNIIMRSWQCLEPVSLHTLSYLVPTKTLQWRYQQLSFKD